MITIPCADTFYYPGTRRSLPIHSSMSLNMSLVDITSTRWNISLLAWRTNRPPSGHRVEPIGVLRNHQRRGLARLSWNVVTVWRKATLQGMSHSLSFTKLASATYRRFGAAGAMSANVRSWGRLFNWSWADATHKHFAVGDRGEWDRGLDP